MIEQTQPVFTNPRAAAFYYAVRPFAFWLWVAVSPFGYLAWKGVGWLANRLHRARRAT